MKQRMKEAKGLINSRYKPNIKNFKHISIFGKKKSVTTFPSLLKIIYSFFLF
jgi:hypothetical protein